MSPKLIVREAFGWGLGVLGIGSVFPGWGLGSSLIGQGLRRQSRQEFLV